MNSFIVSDRSDSLAGMCTNPTSSYGLTLHNLKFVSILLVTSYVLIKNRVI